MIGIDELFAPLRASADVTEAARFLLQGGCFAVFESGYAIGTVATGAGDPLETRVEAFRAHFVPDLWLVRRLTAYVD